MYPAKYNDEREITRFFAFEFIHASEVGADVDWNVKSENIEADGIIYAILPDSEEELNNFLNILFSHEELVIYFLYSFNNFRTIGNFLLNEEQFNIFKIIFCKISDYLLEHKEPKIYFPLIILSQTFYKLNKDKKFFLQNEIRNKKFFLNDEFWKEFLEIKINEELNTFDDNSKTLNFSEELVNNKKKEIIFTKILSLIPCFIGFELEKESMNNILIPIMDKYNMTEDKRKNIFSFIDSYKE